MNKHLLITIVALAAVIIVLPLFGWREAMQIEAAPENLPAQPAANAAATYIKNCAVCHGKHGEGAGPNPPLNTHALRAAGADFLRNTIANGRDNTAMPAWGGVLTDYQINQLARLIRDADWMRISELLPPPATPVPPSEADYNAYDSLARLDSQGDLWLKGIRLYADYCVLCHGVDGEGTLYGTPLNTPDVYAADKGDLSLRIRKGVSGTMMASWDAMLDDDELDALIGFLQNRAKIRELGLQMPVQIALERKAEEGAPVERLYRTNCAACHGKNGGGGMGPPLNDPQFLIWMLDEQINRVVLYGKPHMPAFREHLTPAEVDALVQYIRFW